MKCPHCRVAFHDSSAFCYIGHDRVGHWGVNSRVCPSCRNYIVHLLLGEGPIHTEDGEIVGVAGSDRATLVYPRAGLRAKPANEVPDDVAADFREACMVLSDSPKASAALSRRCLQYLLRHAAGVKPSSLAKEIQQVLDSGKLPTHLADVIDAIRIIGNFSAHPLKSTSTGEIVPVEPHEAEWNLDVLEALFDFYYVQPAVIAKKRALLDQKLADAGKPPLKT